MPDSAVLVNPKLNSIHGSLNTKRTGSTERIAAAMRSPNAPRRASSSSGQPVKQASYSEPGQGSFIRS